MAKKTTKKTTEKKPVKTTKPVTMADRTLTPKQWSIVHEQLKYLTARIEPVVEIAKNVAYLESKLDKMNEFLREATDARVMAIDRRTLEQGKVLDSICRVIALDVGDRLKAHGEVLDKLQGDLSLLLSGASFMQELEQAKPTEEQGLQPGDYTDASKEVADELTATTHCIESERTEATM